MVKCGECGCELDQDEAFAKWRRSLQKDYPDWTKEIGVYCPQCHATVVFHVQDEVT